MVGRRRWFTLVGVFAGTVLLGCAAHDKPAPTGPAAAALPWTGRLVVATVGTDKRGAILELVHDGGGGVRLARRLATTAGGTGALSADGATLLYLGPAGLMRLDVGTAAAQPVQVRVGAAAVAVTDECFQFAPNGKRFLVKDADGRLLAADPTGDAVVIDTPKRETYTEIGGTRRIEAVSSVDCGRWLDDQRVVFDHLRFMPPSLSAANWSQPTMSLSAKDTALAVPTGAGVRLVESVTPWRVVGTCGSWTLTRRGGDAYTPETFLWSAVPEQALAVDGGTTPDTGLMRPGPAMDAYAAATFLPSCNVLVVARAKQQADRLAFRRVNPATGATVEETLTPRAVESLPRFEPDKLAWSPATRSPMFVEMSERDSERLFVTEVSTGLSAPIDMPEPGQIVAILGWLP